jgi:hypothetical protein
MILKTLFAKTPCSKCPYKLGIINTLRNPCPECKASGYKAYEQFVNQNNRKIHKTVKII